MAGKHSASSLSEGASCHVPAVHYKNEKQARIVIAVTMFIYAFFSTALIQLTAPILSYIVEAEGYTDPILSNMIVTIGSLAQIPACLLGAVLGRRMDKKLWTYIGIGCFLIGSLLIIPLSGNIYLVLACRFVVGFGTGILTLLATAVLPDFFEGKSLSAMIGLIPAGGGLWGFLFSGLEANICGVYGWKRAYLVHLYALVPLILFAFLVPSKPLTMQSETGRKKEGKSGIAPVIFAYSFLGAVLYMGVQVVWSNTSLWIRESIGGTAAQIGLISGLFSLCSCGIRLVYGPIYNFLGKKTIHLSAVLLALGLFLASGAGSFAMAAAAGSLVGAAMGLAAPICLNLGIEASPENQVTAQAIITVGFSLGQFLSTYWMDFARRFSDGTFPGIFRISAWFILGLPVVLTVGHFAIPMVTSHSRPCTAHGKPGPGRGWLWSGIRRPDRPGSDPGKPHLFPRLNIPHGHHGPDRSDR